MLIYPRDTIRTIDFNITYATKDMDNINNEYIEYSINFVSKLSSG